MAQFDFWQSSTSWIFNEFVALLWSRRWWISSRWMWSICYSFSDVKTIRVDWVITFGNSWLDDLCFQIWENDTECNNFWKSCHWMLMCCSSGQIDLILISFLTDKDQVVIIDPVEDQLGWFYSCLGTVSEFIAYKGWNAVILCGIVELLNKVYFFRHSTSMNPIISVRLKILI